MIDITRVVWSSLIYGSVLSLLLSIAILGSLRFNPEIWLADYPAEIRANFGPMSEKAKKQRNVFAIFFLLTVIGLPSISIWQLYRASGGQVGFGAAFLNTWIILMVFNLFDLLVLDWLIMVRIQPKFIFLPGTEGMEVYNSYGFHFKGFLKGTVLTLLASLAIAGIIVLTLRVIT